MLSILGRIRETHRERGTNWSAPDRRPFLPARGVSSPNREETPRVGSTDPGVSTTPSVHLGGGGKRVCDPAIVSVALPLDEERTCHRGLGCQLLRHA